MDDVLQEIPDLEQVEENELIEIKINNHEDKSSIFSQKNNSEPSTSFKQ